MNNTAIVHGSLAIDQSAFGQFIEDEVRARYLLTGTLAWDLGLIIPAAHRGGRAFQASWAAAKAELTRRGCSSTMSRVADNNRASLLAQQRMGAGIVGAATFVTLGQRQWTVSAQLPGVHLSRCPDSRPDFTFGT